MSEAKLWLGTNNGNGKDPWKRDGDEPNDLDQIVQEWQRRFGSILGGGGGGGGGGAGGIVLIVMLLIAWGLTGFYRVDEAERGVVQRFGAYTETTMPGCTGIFRSRSRRSISSIPRRHRTTPIARRC